MEASIFIKEKEEEYLNLLSEIISKKSVLGDEYLVAEVIERFLKNRDIPYEVHSLDEKRPNIIARLGNPKGKKIALLAHMDVVPPGEGWETDPFKMTRKGNLIYGRGVSDDKGPLVSILAILDYLSDYLSDSRSELKGQFIAIFTSDEEKGGKFGLKFLLDKDLIDVDCAVVADTPGALKKIMIAEKGSLQLKVISKGEQWHSAYTELGGINALTNMARFISRLEGYLLKHKKHKFLTKPLVNPVSISSGVGSNVIPGNCEAELNIRYLPSQTVESIVSELKGLSDGVGEFNFEVISFSKPFEMDEKMDIISIIRSKAEMKGINPDITGAYGGTDCKKLVKKGIPCVGYCFPEIGAAHQSDESLDPKKLFEYVEIMIDVISEYLS